MKADEARKIANDVVNNPDMNAIYDAIEKAAKKGSMSVTIYTMNKFQRKRLIDDGYLIHDNISDQKCQMDSTSYSVTWTEQKWLPETKI